MVNPNRLLIVAVLGLALIVCGISLLEGDTGEAAVIALMLASLAVALAGQGGRAVFWLAMLVSWIFAAFLPLLGLDLYLHANQVPPYDNVQPYDWTEGSLVLVIGMTGLGCHHLICQTHPAVNKNALDRELNALNVGLISGILFGLLANLLLISFFMEGRWTFVEIIWVYWFESLLITAFGTWTIVKADRLDPRGTRYEHHTTAAIRRQVLENSLRGSAVFYGIYLAIVTNILGPPHVDHLGLLSLVTAALVASHFLEAEQRNRGFSKRKLRLKGMKRVDGWRIVALNIGLLLAASSLVAGSEDAALMFLLIKTGVDVIIAIAQYCYFRAVALESHPRLRIERRRVRARRL
jgi:hypothetical protein